MFDTATLEMWQTRRCVTSYGVRRWSAAAQASQETEPPPKGQAGPDSGTAIDTAEEGPGPGAAAEDDFEAQWEEADDSDEDEPPAKEVEPKASASPAKLGPSRSPPGKRAKSKSAAQISGGSGNVKRPKGRAPKGKAWDESLGEWVDADD